MGDTYPKFKVAAAQAAPVFLDRERTTDKACQLIRAAGKEGAKIIGFPECFIPGFPHWFDFRIARECRGFIKELFKNAVEIPSPSTDALCAAARDAKMTVVMGLNERDPGSMGTLYNTQLFIGPEGHIIGKHRKLVPTWTERLVHTGGDASTLKVFKTNEGPVGGLICGENTNSFYRMTLLLEGERIHVASWPAFPSKAKQDAIDIRTRNYAFEGRCFVISATGVFSEEMTEMLCPTPEQKSKILGTGAFSSIINPAGEYLVGPDRGGENILYADIDPEVIIDEKISHDLTGHYNRFDLFTLVVDDRPVERGPVYSGREEAVTELRSATKARALKTPAADQGTQSRAVKSLRRKR
jgi:nitrilase